MLGVNEIIFFLGIWVKNKMEKKHKNIQKKKKKKKKERKKEKEDDLLTTPIEKTNKQTNTKQKQREGEKWHCWSQYFLRYQKSESHIIFTVYFISLWRSNQPCIRF